MKAAVVDAKAAGVVALREVPEPQPSRDEAVIGVRAISLNRGEVRRAHNAADGWRPGWDFAGVVERAAAGGGPPAGTRVVGMLDEGAWAERIAAPLDRIAVIPDGVSFEQASTLPVAGLTALFALEKRRSLLARRVLVTGASGGVGLFALQLARMGGAHATALVHTPAKRAAAERYAGAVVVGDDAGASKANGPFDVILESVGGSTFASALQLLAPDGTLVTFGTSAERTSTIEVAPFYARGGASVYGFYLFHELRYGGESASRGLERLLALVAAGRLEAYVDETVPFANIGEAAERFWERHVTGKLVLTL